MSFSVPAVSADQPLFRISLNEHGDELITKIMAEVHDVAERFLHFSIAGANITNAFVPTAGYLERGSTPPTSSIANGRTSDPVTP